MKYIFIIFILFITTLLNAQRLQNAFPNLSFSQITDVVCNNNKIYVVEKDGKIIKFDNHYNTNYKKTFINILPLISITGQTGLMSIAFHPMYNLNYYFYLNYIKNDTLYISRFKAINQDSANISSKYEILKIPVLYPGHYGGKLSFGIFDNYLYISTGDSGNGRDTSGTESQKLTSLWGKLLRINIDDTTQTKRYTIPQTNPFYADLNKKGEIYAYGFRNLWKYSFDNFGNIFGADVGNHYVEEINIIINGGNYGWNKMEGNICFPDSMNCDTTNLNDILPIYTYRHFTGPINANGSITGGYISYDSINSSILNKYIYADFVGGMIWSLNLQNLENHLLLDTNLNFSTFCSGFNKELYIASYQGKIYRLRDNDADINKDNIIDLTDLSIVYNDMVELTNGVKNSDMNLDYSIDLYDLLIVYNAVISN